MTAVSSPILPPVVLAEAQARATIHGPSPSWFPWRRSWKCSTRASPTSRCLTSPATWRRSQDESTWVLTSYLVSNAIILPISGWLSNVMGRKRFYMTCVALFTISSLLCGMAPRSHGCSSSASCRELGAAALPPASRRFLPTPSSRKSAEWHLPSTAWPWLSPPRSVRRWAAGSPTTSPGDGSSTSTSPSASSRSFLLPWFTTLLRPRPKLAETLEAWARSRLHGLRTGRPGPRVFQVVLDKGQEDDWFSSKFIVSSPSSASIGIFGGIIWEIFYRQGFGR